MKTFYQDLLLTALLTTSLGASAAVLTGTQQTVTRNLVVAGTAEASVSITPSANVLAGNTGAGLSLASWQASTTGGTIAFRLNPTIVQQSTVTSGFLRNSADQTKLIEVEIYSNCTNPTLIGQWRVCQEGVDSVSGSIRTIRSKTQTLIGGTYPVAIDAVAWTF
ncbi:TPA: hypothetical protein O8L60_004594 [Enterobacter cloacae]|nr:hypothetical protein [Enterobacter cloacae]